MKVCKKCLVEKELPEYGIQKACKDGLRTVCKECRKQESKLQYATKREYIRKQAADRYTQNKEWYLAKHKEWKKENPEKVKAMKKNWDAVNQEHKKAWNKKWYVANASRLSQTKKSNRGRYNAYNAKREAAKKCRTPAYANLKTIQELYEYAALLTKTTGVLHHVDHIIPLQGKTVSGFHIESNLQVVTWDYNLKKSNNFTTEGNWYGSCIIQK